MVDLGLKAHMPEGDGRVVVNVVGSVAEGEHNGREGKLRRRSRYERPANMASAFRPIQPKQPLVAEGSPREQAEVISRALPKGRRRGGWSLKGGVPETRGVCRMGNPVHAASTHERDGDVRMVVDSIRTELAHAALDEQSTLPRANGSTQAAVAKLSLSHQRNLPKEEMMMGRTVRQRLLHQCLVAFSSWQGSPAALTRAGRLPWGRGPAEC